MHVNRNPIHLLTKYRKQALESLMAKIMPVVLRSTLVGARVTVQGIRGKALICINSCNSWAEMKKPRDESRGFLCLSVS